MKQVEKNALTAVSLLLFTFSFVLVGKGECRDYAHTLAFQEGLRARNALRHRIDLLHATENELHQKKASIERQLEAVKHKILEAEQALRSIESTLHH